MKKYKTEKGVFFIIIINLKYAYYIVSRKLPQFVWTNKLISLKYINALRTRISIQLIISKFILDYNPIFLLR